LGGYSTSNSSLTARKNGKKLKNKRKKEKNATIFETKNICNTEK